jgi:hypothetical protein
MSDDDTTSETILQDILAELKGLRQDFQDRNRIIDERFATVVPSIPQQTSPQTPTVQQTNTGTLEPVTSAATNEPTDAVVGELARIEEERQRQAIRDAYIKIINTTYDKAYTNVIGASVRQRAPGGSGWTVCGEQA